MNPLFLGMALANGVCAASQVSQLSNRRTTENWFAFGMNVLFTGVSLFIAFCLEVK